MAEPRVPGRDEPILIMAMPRSGSSMTAGLFAAHGVWTGTCQKPSKINQRGHFENLPIKQMLKARTGGAKPVLDGEPCTPWPGFKDEVLGLIRRDGYPGAGPWLFKGTAMYWPLWEEFRPRWICVRRDLDSVRSSGKATGAFLARAGAVQAHVRALDTLRDERGAVDVDTDALIRGDYRTLEAALASCGIPMDEGKVRAFVDPSLWKHGRADADAR